MQPRTSNQTSLRAIGQTSNHVFGSALEISKANFYCGFELFFPNMKDIRYGVILGNLDFWDNFRNCEGKSLYLK